ncbi:DUF2924 domain-containing protein [Novosphingobium sp. M1R2S20]|uniref:DUF2924 domain-containing protein n=1 Tax=Novosphingobium rhizovicinum TaxID=3228928 RepID=A0ABV3R7N3_9SPHN
MPRVDDALAELGSLSSTTLKARWVTLTGAPVPRISPALLRLVLAWEIQARAYGGLPRPASQRLAQLARAKTATTPAGAGMRLVREWNGTAHVVTVSEDGRVSWNGRDWRSLSEVARAITGTRWSGPAFFGLKTRAAA